MPDRQANPIGRLRSGRATRWRMLALAAVAIAVGAASCTSVDYYWQGMRGQAELIARAEPIEQALATAADPLLRQRLTQAIAIRRFASSRLGLPDNGSYQRYADLRRPYVVWNVVATPEFSLVPRQSCFPVAGCVSYRGFFAEQDARTEAARLAAEGFDVHLGGVPAYSTLGWFDDPLLSTFIHFPEYEVARLIFHELAHQVLYVRDDTTFNESFATTVEEVGIERWLADAGNGAIRADYARAQAIRAGFRELVTRYRRELESLYGSGVDPARMRSSKARILAAMREEHQRIKATQWGGFAGYDAWFQRAGNASLAAVGLYTERVPAFRALLARVDGDLPRFYAAAASVAAAPRGERAVLLAID